MRPLHELINRDDPAFPLVREWVKAAVRPVDVLPPSHTRDDALFQTQVTTRSAMGAVVYETGGIVVDGGWLRILGSGNAEVTRTLPAWNAGRSDGFFLVADDAVGGFFAINGGALGDDRKNLYYFAPDSLEWEPTEMGYSEFLQWAFSGKLDQFYEWIRWPGWDADVRTLHGDRCYAFYPFLFTKEGAGGCGQRMEVPIEEAWGLQMDLRNQLGSPGQDR
ncbi:DUF2625 domain-containing protein [Humisphaera borealis]|uniref:DUF2625 domain-containing protein n=2 Tax=Humisphaera borealis TaxID=2807512 RepID=A0A7M2X418_9BACT|nr:DUF2625 domain-containing protein [Humisphaera borealis]